MLWMDEIRSHHFESMLETITFVGIYPGNRKSETRVSGFGAANCELDFATIRSRGILNRDPPIVAISVLALRSWDFRL